MDSDKFVDALFYAAPALVLLGGAYLLVKKFLDNEYRLRLLEARRNMQKDIVPLRLQAYERMSLFLERIAANNMVVRLYKTGMTARELHNLLITTIRSEFEHNLTQQLYMSIPAWEQIKQSKDEMVKIVAASYHLVGENGTGLELSGKIIDLIGKLEKPPTQRALDFLKEEAHEMFS